MYNEEEERSLQCVEQAAECSHDRKIDDITSGTCVCLDCGLVLEDQIYLAAPNQSDFSAPFWSKKRPPKEEKRQLNEREEMLEICEKLNIPTKLIAAAEVYKDKIVLQLSTGSRKKKFSSLEMLVYALHEILIHHDIRRSSRELAYVAGVQESVIWHVERSLEPKEHSAAPTKVSAPTTDLVECYRALLSLTFQEGKKIKLIIENLHAVGMESYRPNTLIALAVFLYSKHCNLSLKLKEICNVCDVSIGNIYRISKSKSGDEWARVLTHVSI
jgi:transcription initiation factor TFIIIB Brf1 subunit/transcription initiation factor TFIIB